MEYLQSCMLLYVVGVCALIQTDDIRAAATVTAVKCHTATTISKVTATISQLLQIIRTLTSLLTWV